MKIAIICDVPLKENNGTAIAALNLIHFLKKRDILSQSYVPNRIFPKWKTKYVFRKLTFSFSTDM